MFSISSSSNSLPRELRSPPSSPSSMEASAVRILCNSSTRLRPTSLIFLENPLLKTSLASSRYQHHHHHRPISLSPLSLLVKSSIPLGFSNSPSSSQFLISSSFSSSSNFAWISSSPKGNKNFEWNYAENGNLGREIGEKGPVVTAVLLGFLGSKTKHLRRYVELYNERGIHAVTFVASVKDVLSFDLGRKLQERICGLALELISWLSESEKDGRERFLIFHTFSNTGWLAYGAILDSFRGRPDLLEKIKGCVIDSGGDPNIDPKVKGHFWTSKAKEEIDTTWVTNSACWSLEHRLQLGIKSEQRNLRQ